MLLAGTLAAEPGYLSRPEWQAANASGVAVGRLPVLRNTVASAQLHPGARIAVRYPGGDAGNAWATEVREWLVALGISGARVVLEPGSGRPDALALEVIDGP
jgi:hypothetical protein